MKNKILITIWLVINFLLLAKYIADAKGIRCEPCPPNMPCPPCQTNFMKNIWVYVISYNVIMLMTYGIMNIKRWQANNNQHE